MLRFDPMRLKMKIHSISESEMDQKRRKGEFFKIYPRTDSVSKAFYDHQYKLIYDLEKLLESRFGSDETFVSDNVWPIHELKIDVGVAVLSDRLPRCLCAFLQETAPDYAIICLVNESIAGGRHSRYYGRFVLNLREIAVEESLKCWWIERVLKPDFVLE